MNAMSMKTKVAFGCYLVLLLMLIPTGLRYTAASEPRPHHLQAMAVQWEDVQPGVQLMFLAALRTAGATGLVAVLSIGVILFIPFRRGERWARWATPALCIAAVIPVIATGFWVAAKTGASVPRVPLVICGFLALSGFLLSGDVGKPKPSESEAAET